MSEPKKSFWSGLSGGLAATTALITAVGALLAVLVQVGVLGGGDGDGGGGTGATGTTTVDVVAWATEANDECDRTNRLISGLPTTPDPEDVVEWMRQALRLNQQMMRELTALPRPLEERGRIAAFLRAGARMNEVTEDFVMAGVSDLEALLRYQTEISAAGKEFDRVAVDLGASTCAEGSSEIPQG